MRHASPRLAILACLVLSPLVACDSPGDTQGAATNLGVEGASCTSSPECQPPLQCLQQVCTRLPGGDASEADTTMTFDSVPEILEDYDASEWETFQDTVGPTDTGGASDATFFEDCGELGIASSWTGTFAGSIDYDLSAPAEFGIPPQGNLPVNGVLSFEIQCIESKFTVTGELDGTATVVGQGDFPFTLRLAGHYNPQARTMNAQMVDGVVRIYELIHVYFVGVFTGSIQPSGSFAGEWSGHSTGTNLDIITGDAEGAGLWGATAAP